MTLVHDDGTPYTDAEVENLRRFEVVDHSEAGIDGETPPHPGSAEWDGVEDWSLFVARTRKPPKVIEGVRDVRARKH